MYLWKFAFSLCVTHKNCVLTSNYIGKCFREFDINGPFIPINFGKSARTSSRPACWPLREFLLYIWNVQEDLRDLWVVLIFFNFLLYHIIWYVTIEKIHFGSYHVLILSVYQKSDKPLVIWAYFSIVHEMNQIPVSTLGKQLFVTCINL